MNPPVSPLIAPVIVPADARHIDALMVVMRASFDPAFGEAWSALQLGGTLALDNACPSCGLRVDRCECRPGPGLAEAIGGGGC